MGLGVEEAATYLSLLKSTDQSNVTSVGGVRSVMHYSGLARAVDNHRSMSAEIIHRLEKSFKANEGPHFPDRINGDAE